VDAAICSSRVLHNRKCKLLRPKPRVSDGQFTSNEGNGRNTEWLPQLSRSRNETTNGNLPGLVDSTTNHCNSRTKLVLLFPGNSPPSDSPSEMKRADGTTDAAAHCTRTGSAQYSLPCAFVAICLEEYVLGALRSAEDGRLKRLHRPDDRI